MKAAPDGSSTEAAPQTRRQVRRSVSSALIDRTIAALRKNGVNVTAALCRPDGSVLLETPDSVSRVENDDAFNYWERRHGKGS